MHQNEKRATIYARSATLSECGASSSLDTQIAACLQYASDHNYPIVAEHICKEIGSGITADRYGLQALLAAAKRGEFTTLLIYDYERLARSFPLLQSLIQQFAEAGVTVIAITQPVPFAALEPVASAIHHAVKESARNRKAPPPFGYTRNETGVTLHPQQTDHVQRLINPQQ